MARPLKMVHTCMRVRDIDASLRFYEALGFERRGKLDFGSAYNIYLGLPGDGDTLELTVNAGQDEPYDLGNGYGHVAIAVEDAYKACEEIKKRGGKVTREAGPMKHGTTVIAFVEDPDGYKIELIQR